MLNIFITAKMGPLIGAPMTVLSVFFMIFRNTFISMWGQ